MFCNSFDFLGIPLFSLVLESNLEIPFSFGIPDEPPCYVGQYASVSLKLTNRYLFVV